MGGFWLPIEREERESGTCYIAAKRVIIKSAAGMALISKAKPNAERFGFADECQGVERKSGWKQLKTV